MMKGVVWLGALKAPVSVWAGGSEHTISYAQIARSVVTGNGCLHSIGHPVEEDAVMHMK